MLVNVQAHFFSMSPAIVQCILKKSDYLRDLQAELMNDLVKLNLKPDALPHLDMPRCSRNLNQIASNDDHRARAEKRNVGKEIFKILLKQ